jgi:Tol biopolymer transport system component
MKRLSTLTAIFILLSFSFGSLAAQNGYDLFQKALAKERGEGNLEEAISLYQKVVAETKDESLAAKAQFRIGICYEKLGQEKAKLAQAAFQKVISDYPGQREVVRMAQEKLSILLRAQAALEKGDKEFRVRQVWTGKEVDGSGEVSFDGKYLSFVDWETGDLAIREMATGKKRHLTHNDREKSNAFAEAETSVWSPDGKQLAYIWEKYAKGQVEVHIVGLDGSEPRLLHQVDSYKGWVELADWSPDGKNILAYFINETRQCQLGLISIKDSSIQILKTFDVAGPPPYLMKAQFSPDGRYIVYDFPQERGSRKKDISLISSDEIKEAPLIAHPADDYLLGWSPDGKWILFSSDRTGTRDAWIIQVSDGKPQGDPQLVRQDMGLIGSLGFSQDGSFYYSTEGAMFAMYDIYSAKLDPETGNIIEQPKKDPLPYEGHNIYPEWSPDGKHLLYISGRGPGKRQPILCIYSVESGRVRELDLKEKFIYFSYPHWCPDGRSILLLAEDFQSGKGIYRIDAQTGEVTLIIPKKENESSGALWSPVMSRDGKLLFYIHENMSDKYYPLVVRDLETGKEEELLRNPPYNRNTIALSPDGQRLALLLREEENLRVLKVMSIKGGEPLELHRFELKWRDFVDIDWSPDGRYIYFSKQELDSEGGKWELWRVPAKGGKAENLGSTMMRYFIYLSVHPDGERITFASVHSMLPEIWVMENFLPKDKQEGKGG